MATSTSLHMPAEVGGRLNDTALELLSLLARHKVRNAPYVLRRSAHLAWADRWSTLLGVALQDAVSAAILEPARPRMIISHDLPCEPELDELLDQERDVEEGLNILTLDGI